MTEEHHLCLKCFHQIKIISAVLFILGGILSYYFASSPETMLFQFGGIPFNLIIGIFPLLCGIFLFIYTALTSGSFDINIDNDVCKFIYKKSELSLNKNEIKVVIFSDAPKFAIWFVFFFINFYFVYYGIECVLYFSANHNAGLLEFSFYSMMIVWFAGLILLLFPRNLLEIITPNKRILQKISQIPKDGSFERFFNEIFGLSEEQNEKIIRSNRFLYRLILGIIFVTIFILTSMLVIRDEIVQPLHDLGIWIPIILLLSGVMMISSSIKEKRIFKIKNENDNIMINCKALIGALTQDNYIWLNKNDYQVKENLTEIGFRKLSFYQYLLIMVLFGQAAFLGFKIFWLPFVYADYFDIYDMIIAIIMIIVLFFFSFEIVYKLDFKSGNELKPKKEILLGKVPGNKKLDNNRNQNLFQSIKIGFKRYFNNFKVAVKNDTSRHLLKIFLACIFAIVLITISYVFLGFVIFIFI
ncbi:MAG: TcpD family membrane protein [Promethearchaeia archaeon]